MLNLNLVSFVVSYFNWFYILYLSIPVIPTKITIKLNGALKDFLDFIQGIYILGPKLVNGKACWIQEGGSVALWYNKYNGIGNWNIGDLEDIGSNEVGLYCLDESNVPIEIVTWFYQDDDEWKETTDISILPVKGNIYNFLFFLFVM